jgi:hypothetical protein
MQERRFQSREQLLDRFPFAGLRAGLVWWHYRHALPTRVHWSLSRRAVLVVGGHRLQGYDTGGHGFLDEKGRRFPPHNPLMRLPAEQVEENGVVP